MTPENIGMEMAKAYGDGAGRESINKVANFFGAIVPFWGLRKKAVDVYVREIENSDRSPEEKFFLISNAKKHCNEVENQMAIAQVAQDAAAAGTDFSVNSTVNPEFVLRFLDAGKYVFDEEIQLLWGNVLAGEFETPGSTPPSIIRILSELTKEYATIFSKLCSLNITIIADNGEEFTHLGRALFFTSSKDVPYLEKLGITFDALQELESLGLINASFSSFFVSQLSNTTYPKLHLVSETSAITVIEFPDRSFPLGYVSPTKAGACIARFVTQAHNPDHMDAIKTFLKKNGVKCAETPDIKIIEIVEDGNTIDYDFQRI